MTRKRRTAAILALAVLLAAFAPMTPGGMYAAYAASDADIEARGWAALGSMTEVPVSKGDSDIYADVFYAKTEGQYWWETPGSITPDNGDIYTALLAPVGMRKTIEGRLRYWVDGYPVEYARVTAAASSILAAGGTEAQTAESCLRWVTEQIDYDYPLYYGQVKRDDLTAMAALRRSLGVCQHYAELSKAVLNACGIPAYVVVGTMNGQGHAWTALYIDGAWRYADNVGSAERTEIYDHPDFTSGSGYTRLSENVGYRTVPRGSVTKPKGWTGALPWLYKELDAQNAAQNAPRTVTLKANGKVFKRFSVKKYGRYPALPTPSKEGYRFKGWYLIDYENLVNFHVKEGSPVGALTSDVTLTARWIPKEYKVTLSPNGGKLPAKAKATFLAEYESWYGWYSAFTDTKPVRAGHTFTGWYTKKSGGKKVTKSMSMKTALGEAKAHTLYAHWKRK